VFHGYAELGQGAATALLQIAAEELDLGIEQMNVAALGSHRSPNQGATAASASVALGGQPRPHGGSRRRARRCCGSHRAGLGAPVESLTVERGVVSDTRAGGARVSYGEHARRQAHSTCRSRAKRP
jgi:nicotinate dehydrogenase subunit B